MAKSGTKALFEKLLEGLTPMEQEVAKQYVQEQYDAGYKAGRKDEKSETNYWLSESR